MPGSLYIGPYTAAAAAAVAAIADVNNSNNQKLKAYGSNGCNLDDNCAKTPGAWNPPFTVDTGGLDYTVPATNIIANPLGFDDAELPLIGGGTVTLSTYLSDPSGYEINSTGLAIGGFPLNGFQTCDEMYSSLTSFAKSVDGLSYEISLPLITSYTNTSGNDISVSGWCPDNNFANLDSSGIIPGYSGDFVQSTWLTI